MTDLRTYTGDGFTCEALKCYSGMRMPLRIAEDGTAIPIDEIQDDDASAELARLIREHRLETGCSFDRAQAVLFNRRPDLVRAYGADAAPATPIRTYSNNDYARTSDERPDLQITKLAEKYMNKMRKKDKKVTFVAAAEHVLERNPNLARAYRSFANVVVDQNG